MGTSVDIVIHDGYDGLILSVGRNNAGLFELQLTRPSNHLPLVTVVLSEEQEQQLLEALGVSASTDTDPAPVRIPLDQGWLQHHRDGGGNLVLGIGKLGEQQVAVEATFDHEHGQAIVRALNNQPPAGTTPTPVDTLRQWVADTRESEVQDLLAAIEGDRLRERLERQAERIRTLDRVLARIDSQ